MKLCVYSLLATLLLTSISSFAQEAGSTPYDGLLLTCNARTAALGGTFLAVVDEDVNLSLMNPSLLNVEQSGYVGFNYVNFFSDINLGEFGAAYALDSSKVISAGFKYFDYGDFTRTDAAGNENGSFGANALSASIGIGIKIDSLFTFGGKLKTYSASIDNLSSFALGADLALSYNKASKGFVATAMLKDIGYELSTFNNSPRNSLPFEIQLGFSKKLKHAPFRFNVMLENLQTWDLTFTDPSFALVIDPSTGDVVNDNRWDFGDKLMRHVVVGTEILISDNLQFRAGYNYRRRQELKINDRPGTAGLSFGAGVRIKRFHINYGRSIYHQAGASNTFSLTTKIG